MTKPKKPGDSRMTGATFKATLERIGISQMGFSRLIGVSGRTVRSWISDEFPLPKAVALLVHLIQKTKINPADLGNIEP